MATRTWIGTATPTVDVWTITIGGTIEAGDLFTATIGGKTLSYAATGTTTTGVATGFATAWNNLDSATYPEFGVYTAEASGSTVILTAATAGIPATISVLTTESNGGTADSQTMSITNTTPASGPNFWNVAANWAEGSVPVSNDDVVIENSSVDILYGLDQNSVTLTSLKIKANYTGRIGLPRYNPAGYYEYRETYLKISATTLTIGEGEGEGSSRIKINVGSAACTCTVSQTANGEERDIPAFLFRGTSSSNVLNVTKGQVGVAIYSGETANLTGGLNIGYEGNLSGDSFVWCGSGVTLATVNQYGGTLLTESNITTVNHNGGVHTHSGSATVGTINNRGGTYFHESSGTITTLTNLAVFDRRRTTKTGTITNAVSLYAGSTFVDPEGTLTLSGGFTTVQCTLDDVTVLTGRNKTYSIS